MELKKPLVKALAHTISCVALHRRRYGLQKWPLAISVAGEERLASGASQSNDKRFFKFHRVSMVFPVAFNSIPMYNPEYIMRNN